MPSKPEWASHAEELAQRLTDPQNRWYAAVRQTPRHRFTPRWYVRARPGWHVRDGEADHEAWMHASYQNLNSVITRVGPLHADHAEAGSTTRGLPTSSATNPWLVMTMYRHTHLYPGCRVLDVGTGSGYGTALLARVLGDDAVTSIDIDPYLTRAAPERLDSIGLNPRILTGDATAPLDWSGDRIVAMVACGTRSRRSARTGSPTGNSGCTTPRSASNRTGQCGSSAAPGRPRSTLAAANHPPKP